MSAGSAQSGTQPAFELALPPGWVDRSVYTFTGPVEHGVRHTLTIEVDEQGGKQGLEGFVADRIASVRAAAGSAEVLKDCRDTLAGSVPIHELILKQTGPDGTAMLVRRVFKVEGAAGVVFTATYTKWSARTRGAQIDRMIESFRLGA